MSRLSDLIQDINRLPNGYISIKHIHNDVYYYLQWKDNKKIVGRYIRKEELPQLEKDLEKRRECEHELMMILREGKNLPILSSHARELTGSLMMANKVVAKFKNGAMIYVDQKLAPLYLIRTKDISSFLASRSIDDTRTNSRLLKRALGIKENSNDMVALYAHGATITDNYWFKASGSKLKYKDILFEKDLYADLALKGKIDIIPPKPKINPQLTLIGSYEKCWKLINGEWWLFKSGNNEEIFSELFVSLLAKALHIPTVIYTYDDIYIKCKNFATKYNFEPMSSLVGKNDDYNVVFNALNKISKDIAKEYLLLMWFDALVFNFDRHSENMGLMRDKKTGKIISLAPNFDNNLSLISYSKNLRIDNKDDVFIHNFIKFLKSDKLVITYFKEIKLPKLDEKMIKDIFKKIVIKEDEALISKYLLNRYEILTHIKFN